VVAAEMAVAQADDLVASAVQFGVRAGKEAQAAAAERLWPESSERVAPIVRPWPPSRSP
jgi:hypothetical protein